MSNKSATINVAPEGWWYQDERNSNWHGPFATEKEALHMGRALAPDRSEYIRLMHMRAWEYRRVLIKQYRDCPNCDRGFLGGWSGSLPIGPICRKCEGSGRLETDGGSP